MSFSLRLVSGVFVAATASIVALVACTVENTSVAPSGSACDSLAQKCPYCTLPNLKQTCEAAVASKDPKSCQNGLDDKDVQSNCKAPTGSSGGSSSSSGGASSSSSGGASSSSSSSGGASSTCNGGGSCTCSGPAGCDRTCDGKACAFECFGPGGCTLDCAQGGCTAKNKGAGGLTLTCAGGGCTATTESSGSASVSCGGKGNCTCTKSGTGTCSSMP
ncbi:MAG: hypothetical protein JNL38_38845 [Myxococcales bacterium]|nr:hypothetical protein [Myxococcales bacterium]